MRNIGVIAHRRGKTTFSEDAVLYPQPSAQEQVHDGTATMDYLPEEQERASPSPPACTTAEWNGTTVNIIDTPGHVDFTIEVGTLAPRTRRRSASSAPWAAWDAIGTVWRQSEHFGVPKLASSIRWTGRADFPPCSSPACRPGFEANPPPVATPGAAVFVLIRDLGAADFTSPIRRYGPVRPQRGRGTGRPASRCQTAGRNDDAFLEQYLGGANMRNRHLQRHPPGACWPATPVLMAVRHSKHRRPAASRA